MKTKRPTKRERLSALLAEKGIEIKPYDLDTQQGAYRSVLWDLARWFGSATYKGRRLNVCSWCTMTDCVRYGIDIVSIENTEIEVCSRKS